MQVGKFILAIVFIGMHYFAFAQPSMRWPKQYNFRFYDKYGELVTPNSKTCSIKIQFQKYQQKEDAIVSFNHGFYSCLGYDDENALILFICESDTMEIETRSSHDVIPFAEGKFTVPREFRGMFSIKPLKNTRILNKNLKLFSAQSFDDAKTFPLLDIEVCEYWGNLNNKESQPTRCYISGLLSNSKIPNKIFAWGSRGFEEECILRSEDNGKNWQEIKIFNDTVYRDDYFNILNITYKEKGRLVMSADTGFLSLPLIMQSFDDGETWDVDSILSANQFYFIHFFSPTQGIAFLEYHQMWLSSKFYKTTDGETWQSCGRIGDYAEQIIYPQKIKCLSEKICFVESYSYTYGTFNGGKRWRRLNHNLPYNNPPNIEFADELNWFALIRDTSGFTHNFTLYKTSNAGQSWISLLELSNDSYIRIFCNSKNVVVASQSYTLVSHDKGENFIYYPQSFRAGYDETKVCFLEDYTLLVMDFNNILKIKLK